MAVAGIPPELEAIVDRALRKRREERFASVTHLYAALEPFAEEASPARPKLDRFVEIGGVQIPVTWEDTGGNETPASGGVKMLDVAALRSAIQAEAVVTGGVGRPPGHVAASARAARTPEAPGEGPADAFGGRTAAQNRGSSSPVRESRSRPSVGSTPEPATRRSGTAKPPPIDDEETTMVLLGSIEASTEEPTPPLRRAGSGVTPPPPPPREPSGSVGSRYELPPAEDTETTIVDSEPPNFSTDAYRAARDRKEP